MSIEEIKSEPIINKEHKKLIDMQFKDGNKLNSDVINMWMKVLSMDNSKEILEKAKPLGNYEDYLKKEEENYPGLYDYVMSLSDKEAIIKFNSLIDKFNAELDTIKKDFDFNKIRKYIEKARKITQGEIIKD